MHYVCEGSVGEGNGATVLLLHGWPGFSYDWRRIIPELSQSFRVIAPDFRGFGNSDKPNGDPAEFYTPQVLAKDLIALLDHLKIGPVIIVAHDIGSTVAQVMAREYPDRVQSLLLLNPPYPGIGDRRFLPSAQKEFWYQNFHNLPIAEQLVGYNRATVKIYLTYFYNHWTGRKDALREEELEVIIDMYAKPDAFAKSIYYYRARAGARKGEGN
ncbi:alpha/beta hydrolase [Effusibacillus dendaii]|uniref:AB hydrolase-1 domain-containing protein n=1 Tax=Effusibacillus dendaii TaxID=2743772 RepID=A0A7I8DHA0_9BACL|nr:alpha/beta hydrolase [Effusibacillus dendaii]BCJ87990.1 hypothetical protein skT53_29750 [Effusibacillus dendaii]